MKNPLRCHLSCDFDNLKEEMIRSFARQNKLKDEYTKPDDLPKVNKYDIDATIEGMRISSGMRVFRKHQMLM